jgi:chemotaxis signal transduction protein
MAANERKFLIFFMHEQCYAFDLVHVAEVMDPVMSWPIPFAPPCCSDAINFHGAIVAVMDLAVFLGFASCSKIEKIIVLDVNVASLGFLIERVVRIVPEQEIELHEAPDVRFASALLSLPEGDATLLDIFAIIKEAEILMAV